MNTTVRIIAAATLLLAAAACSSPTQPTPTPRARSVAAPSFSTDTTGSTCISGYTVGNGFCG